MAIIVVDDILDNDPKGIYRSIGAGRAANIAAALQAISLDLIQAAALTPPRKRMAIYYLNSMMSQTAYGQSLDVLNPADEESYWQLVQHKSTPFYATAFALGAIFADAAPALIDAICKLGMVYGEMIQIHDDIKDSLSNPADPDWLEGRNSLPILFASIVQHPEQGQFLALREHIEQTENLREAQDILVRSGAISYCLDQLVIKYSEAQVLLAQTPAQKPELLSALFDELVEPMKELLETGGMSIPSALARIS
jgi:geranylgeranyl pyrophosphate synthase